MIFGAIYESDYLKAELEHDNDEASSDHTSAECGKKRNVGEGLTREPYIVTSITSTLLL